MVEGKQTSQFPTCEDSREVMTPPTEQAFWILASVYLFIHWQILECEG